MGVQWIDSVVRKYRDLAMVVSQRGWRLQGEDEPESIFDILEQLSSDAARRLGQEITIDRDDFHVYRRNKREVIPLVCPPER